MYQTSTKWDIFINSMTFNRQKPHWIKALSNLSTPVCHRQGQKLCRQLKAAPDPHVLNHYKDGKFHKVYDRQETTKSLVRFMHDPTGDRPWEEETAGKSVVHLDNPSVSLF